MLDLFGVILSIYIGLGMICLFLGMVFMLVVKKKGWYIKWGEVYYVFYVVLVVIVIMLVIWKWNEIVYLFYIVVFLYGLVIYGYVVCK